jgi:SAM-dependent methyltransferase
VYKCSDPIKSYHLHHQHHLEDLPFWQSLAQSYGAPTLELGCGTGRVLLPFLRVGVNGYGVDHDLEMLNCLRNLAAADHLSPNVLLADFTRLNLRAKFKVILLPCNTYSMLDYDQRQALLNNVPLNLAPGGIFAISIPNPAVLLDLPEYSYPQIEEAFSWIDSDAMMQVSSSWTRTSDLFTFTWHYDLLTPDGRSKRYTRSTTHFVDTSEVILSEIEAAGYTIKDLYGDFDRSGFSSHAPYLIMILDRQR